MWAFADQGSYKMTIRRAKKNWKKAKKTADELKKIIKEQWNEDVLYDRFVTSILGQAVKKSEYVFVSDLFKEQYIGGAELSLQVLIDECSGTKTTINSASLTEKMIDFNKDATWVFGNIALFEI